MPRSRRKAVQAKAPPADFVKKKTKLGKRRRAENATDTRITARKVHIRTQTGKRSLNDIIARTRHHNVQARKSAFEQLVEENGCDMNVLLAGLQGIVDENGAVRKVAEQVVVKNWKLDEKVVGVRLIGGLSDVRDAVRKSVAGCVSRVLKEGGRIDGRVWECCEGVVGDWRGGELIGALCESGEKKKGDEEDGVDKGEEGFYYHGEWKREDVGMLDICEEEVWEKLVNKVCYLILESFPLAGCRRDERKARDIESWVKALKGLLLKKGGKERVEKVVLRVVDGWGGEMRRIGVKILKEVQEGLAEIGMRVGKSELVAEFVKRGGIVSADVVEEIVQAGGAEVGLTWLERYEGEGGLSKVVDGMKGVEGVVERLVGIVKRKVDVGEGLECLRKVVVGVGGSDGGEGECVDELVEGMEGMGERERKLLVAVLYYAGKGCSEQVLRKYVGGMVEMEEGVRMTVERRGDGWLDGLAALSTVLNGVC